MLFEILHQRGWHLLGKILIGKRREVSRVVEDADFIFNLHHQNGVRGAVYFANVAHQSSKGTCVGCLGLNAGHRREHIEGLAGSALCSRKALRVLFDPERRIARHTVFPTS